MTRTEDIIEEFETEVDDITELSSDSELALANRAYFKIMSKPYEILKKNASGSISSDATSYYIDLPEDFQFLSTNFAVSEQNYSNDDNLKAYVIFVGTNYVPYKVINYSDRMQYRNWDQFCYIDIANDKIRFFVTPTQLTYSYDYIRLPDELTLLNGPIWPERYDVKFNKAIVYEMAIDNEIIQKSNKAKSYKQDWEIKAFRATEEIDLWNSKFLNY